MMQALIKIEGRVQGVFFRAHAKEKATILELTGYAKNLPDDSVECLVQGEKDKIRDFIEWCKDGSPSAKVSTTKVDWQNIKNQMYEFDIR